MKSSIKVLLLSLTTPIFLLSAEPSAFGAGDLSSPEPYGLTSNEQVILDTKQKLKQVAQKSSSQASQLDSLRERIDGLQSIVESLSRKSHNNKINLQQLKEDTAGAFVNSNEYQKRVAESVTQNTQDIKELKVAITEISKLLDTINAQYVSKSEFNSLVDDVNNFKSLMAQELKSKSKFSSKATGDSSAELYKLAKENYAKKYYTKAIANFEELIKRKYKPAFAHYMIGEMNYKRKNYAKAISYFKKSSELYSKARYMPTLMLHTAISMDKTGDRAHAKAFYKAIIAKYPSSKEAKVAKNKLGL